MIERDMDYWSSVDELCRMSRRLTKLVQEFGIDYDREIVCYEDGLQIVGGQLPIRHLHWDITYENAFLEVMRDIRMYGKENGVGIHMRMGLS